MARPPQSAPPWCSHPSARTPTSSESTPPASRPGGPARTQDLSGLPDAWIGVGGLDLFLDEDLGSATQKWDDWVRRDATLVSRKDQAQDSSGVPLELLWLSFRLRPALVPEVAIAELRLATAEHEVAAPSGAFTAIVAADGS